jgi:hypothetical protein
MFSFAANAGGKSTDPGGIGGMRMNPAVVQVMKDGRPALVLSRAADGLWQIERPRSQEAVSGLLARSDVVVVVPGAGLPSRARQLEDATSLLKSKAQDFLLEEQCEPLLTQIHLGALLLQSDRHDLWTGADFERVLSPNSRMAAQWKAMNEVDDKTAAEIRALVVELSSRAK